MEKQARAILTLLITLAVTLLLVAVPSVSGQKKNGVQDPQQPEVIKLDTILVTVPVIVTDPYGRFVTGLSRNDFILREDGALQEIADFSSTEAPFNVALLIDTSRSTRNKLKAIRKAALEFIKQLQPDDRVLIVSFDERVRFLGQFTNNRKELERAVNSLESGYLTSLYDAIYLTVTEKLLPLAGRKAMVVLTDGVDTASRLATYESSLELISNTGIVSYAIQYETRNDGGPIMRPLFIPTLPLGGSSLSRQDQSQFSGKSPAIAARASNSLLLSSLTILAAPQQKTQSPPRRDPYLIATEYLRALALRSGAQHIRAESIENTALAFAFIANELRHQYTLSYYSLNNKRDGTYRAITVSVKNPQLIVRARQGYHAPRDEQRESR